ncbi:NAD(P)/FAD-dependent oxidoreductase [Verrucomicrobium sp. BvORR034]|uniref:NAD(P)/FAD-dependent oxidoreductase n=1 Tax=Verrucomicrobium sp. BvORR034 TaxID=1396418 RepID=UPI000679DF39|nr:NAD(P)/FAD-dependent oxidoreductase [Verrucomicrobium sp. BvORR034]
MNPSESSENPWDVVIIGGGPAGSSAATTLAQAGRKVLLLEKEKFPRFHIGESLLPYNREVFEQLGVWDKISKAGFMRKKGAQFLLGDGTRKVRLDFSKGSFTEFSEAVQVERAKLDNILLTHAQETGAEVRQESLVQELQVNADGVVVRYRDKEGSSHEVKAKFLIDASGLSNFTANRENRRTYYPEHKKIAIFSHFAGVDMPQGEEYGDILVIRRENSWFWMIPLEDDKVSVGLVMDRGDFQALGQEPKQVFEDAVRNTAAVQQRFTKVAPPASVHVATDFSYRNNSLVSDRVIRAGDASGFIDPVFSSGVLLATTSGRQAGLVADEAITLGKTLTPAMQAYESDTRARIGQYWQFIEKFYTKHFAQLFFQPSNRFKMMCSINAVLAGCTQLPLHVRLRLKLFFGLVWLQKKFSFAEEITIK